MRDPTHEIDILNDLLEQTSDSYRSYQEAEARSKDPSVTEFFNHVTLERKRAVRALQRAVQDLQGRPVESGTLMGSARRMLMDLRAQLSDTDDVLLADLARDDEHLLSQMKTALSDYRLSDIGREALSETFFSIDDSRGTLQELRDSMHKTV